MTPETDGRATARGDPPEPSKVETRQNAHAAEVAKAARFVSPPRRSGRQSMARVARPTAPEPLTPDAEVPR